MYTRGSSWWEPARHSSARRAGLSGVACVFPWPNGATTERWTDDVSPLSRHRRRRRHRYGVRGALRFQGRNAAPQERDNLVYAMLVMSLSGAVMAVGRAGAALNIPAGLVTAYWSITSLATVRPPFFGIAAAGARGHGGGIRDRRGQCSGRHRRWVRGAMAFPLLMFARRRTFAGEGDRRMIRAGGRKGASRSGGTCGACVPRCSSRRGHFSWGRSDAFLSRSASRRYA